ncbi:nitrite/sulfite reductase [Leptothrix ochracea]|uniref:nitrite/sulfite reductase n=1 Tax=Leptothrix ochracea TaxID=735331 RepID=UPI0034E23FAC
MYSYTDFDRRFIRARAAQFRDQLERNLKGELSDDEFRPLRLQNGWYVQRHAPMLRVAVPYGEISSSQLRTLASIASDFDRGFAHLTTRQNVQFNWIPLNRAADVMDRLVGADMHGIQTSGNCIRNTTSDALAGIAVDEVIDPRPYAELLRQWSTLHPEFAFLPRKFKVAIIGATEDRAAIAWHDIGLQLLKNEQGAVGFRVLVGGGMGRTPIIASEISAFIPWQQILVFMEAIVRVYNLFGRRDNAYKARIKILVKAEGAAFTQAVEKEFQQLLVHQPSHLLSQEALDRVSASFTPPAALRTSQEVHFPTSTPQALTRWLSRNVHPHKHIGYRAVTLSLKYPGQAPGDITAEQMRAAADLADRFSHGELRITHDQNLLLPWVRCADLAELHEQARAQRLAQPNIGLLTDMITCPGGDFCALANARSLPVAKSITERFEDLDALFDIGDIDLHISGCMNSCGHHHTGHIGILGIDKDGSEWYQITLGGSDGSALSGASRPGKVIGPSFAAEEVPDVIEALIDVYQEQRQAGESFIDTLHRIGADAFKTRAHAVRTLTTAAQAL